MSAATSLPNRRKPRAESVCNGGPFAERGRQGTIRRDLSQLPVPTRDTRGYAACVRTWRPVATRWQHSRTGSGAALLLTLFVFAGCGGSHINLQSPRPTTPTGSSSTGSSGSTDTSSASSDGGQDPAILSAYHDSLSDFNAVATQAPVQGNKLTLADHMEGQQLQFVTAQLLKLAEAGQVDTGGLMSIHARVKEFSGNQAVVEACERDTVQVVSTATGQVVGAAAPSKELVDVLMEESSGAWKVSTSSNVSPGCS